MAVGFQWSMYSALLLLSVHAAQPPQSLQGLYCVNDFVRNVTCIWRRSAFHPGSDCWVSSVRKTYVDDNGRRESKDLVHRCKLEGHGGFPRCTFSFDMAFNPFETLPSISCTCNGTLIETQRKYSLKNHIKMAPPGAPSVNTTVNMTRIWWSLGRPRSKFVKSFDFQVQIKQLHQSWDEVKSQTSKVQEITIWQRLKGHLQVRVRMKSLQWDGGHWSEWGPTTSWTSRGTVEPAADSMGQATSRGQPSVLVFIPLAFSLGLSFVSVLAFYMCCTRKKFHREKKTVPNPSKYFCTLHSVHGGNLKKWLNPAPEPESFFLSRPSEDICVVEVCDSPCGSPFSPCGSPCSSSALIHSPSAGDPLSAGSSSCFSNMDYFMSSCGSSSAHTGSCSNQGNVLSPHRKLQLSLCPSLVSSSIYESLRREPQSPDSGFGRFEEQDMDSQSSPLLLHLPVSSSLSPASHVYPSAVNLVFDNHALEEDAPVTASPAVSGTLLGWPGTEPMCRASSLPVDTSKSGYLTLKELHTTFSNKSI